MGTAGERRRDHIVLASGAEPDPPGTSLTITLPHPWAKINVPTYW
jgi:hypothetical protein